MKYISVQDGNGYYVKREVYEKDVFVLFGHQWFIHRPMRKRREKRSKKSMVMNSRWQVSHMGTGMAVLREPQTTIAGAKKELKDEISMQSEGLVKLIPEILKGRVDWFKDRFPHLYPMNNEVSP